MATYQDYETASVDYLAQFRLLGAGGADDSSSQGFVETADTLADISAAMIPLGSAYVTDSNPAVRLGISNQFFAQARAELQVATDLLQRLDGGTEAQASTTVRSSSSRPLKRAIVDLESVMALPVGAVAASTNVRSGISSKTVKSAKQAVETQALVSIDAILLRIHELGGDIAFDMVLQSDWGAIVGSGGLLHKDFGELLDKVRGGVADLLDHGYRTIRKLFLNVYDKLLALLGNDATGEARQRVQGWLNDIAEHGDTAIFPSIINRLYKIDEFKQAIPHWVLQSDGELAQLNGMVEAIGAMTNGFIALEKQLKSCKQALVLAKMVRHFKIVPQLFLVIASLQLLLLTTVVYVGADYIGFDGVRFSRLDVGLAGFLRTELGVGSN